MSKRVYLRFERTELLAETKSSVMADLLSQRLHRELNKEFPRRKIGTQWSMSRGNCEVRIRYFNTLDDATLRKVLHRAAILTSRYTRELKPYFTK